MHKRSLPRGVGLSDFLWELSWLASDEANTVSNLVACTSYLCGLGQPQTSSAIRALA